MTNRAKKLDHWESIVCGIVSDYQRLSAACDAAIKAGCMDINGPLYDAIWVSFQGMLDRIDESGWISWFIYENGCGRKRMVAKSGRMKKLVPIRNARQVARLIVDWLED